MGNQNLFWFRDHQKRVKAGDLFNPISIARSSSAPEGGEEGVGYIETLDTYINTWARVDLKPQWMLEGTGNNNLLHIFTIREIPNQTIESTDLIVFNNRIFRIHSIEDLYPDDKYRRFTVIKTMERGRFKDRDVVTINDEGDPITVTDPTSANPLWGF